MNITISPCKLKGTITAPPSKSYAHRMLICAALADGTSRIEGISSSEDMLATMDCIRTLGMDCDYDPETGCAQITGNRRQVQSGKKTIFPCRESGSTLRFMIPLALTVLGGGMFTGTPRLMERGVGVYDEIFNGQDIQIRKDAERIVLDGQLKAGQYRIRGDVSSQFVTGMLLALSLLKEDSVIEVLPPVESRAYIDITIDVMKQFGVEVTETSANVFHIPGGQKYQAGEYRVEGDWSNAAFLYTFHAVGSELDIRGLKEDSIQGDRKCVEFLNCLKEQKMIDLSDTPDLGPVLFAAAAALCGGRFTGTRRLRIKESDRAAAMAEELSKFGVTCTVEENEVVVHQEMLKKPSVPLNGHNDHRIVMALSVLASLMGGTIEGAEAVRKSWPDYFETMKTIGLQAEATEELEPIQNLNK